MGSVGILTNHKFEDIKGTSIIFGTAHIAPNYIDIDGYSNKKTVKGALSDLAKALEKYDKGEADSLRSAIKFGETEQVLPDKSLGPAQYILEYEEVPVATQENEKGDMKYKPANWYVRTRFIKS